MRLSSARALLAMALWIASGCQRDGSPPPRGTTLEIDQELPHDRDAYTQGLVYRGGYFFESTGLNGRSSVRKVEPATGEVLDSHSLQDRYFGEGLVALDDRLYQLTWRQGVGFIYSAESLDSVGEFRYTGEGWGLTSDGTSLIMSDGTYRLRYLDPKSFAVTRTVDVTDDGRAVFALNELEWVDGEIWANVWQQDDIARIDPATGEVLGWLNVRGFLSWFDRLRGAEVANGIAYDSIEGRLWVTGKNWPRLFEVRIPSATTGR